MGVGLGRDELDELSVRGRRNPERPKRKLKTPVFDKWPRLVLNIKG